MYKLNFRNLSSQLTPLHKRNSRLVLWFEVIMYPIKKVHSEFHQLYTEKKAELEYNCQIVYLQRLLNLKFNNGQEGIIVKNTGEAGMDYLDYSGRQKPYFIKYSGAGSQYLNYASNSYTEVDFIVMIPKTLNIDISMLKAVVNKYKLASKTFKILKYEPAL